MRARKLLMPIAAFLLILSTSLAVSAEGAKSDKYTAAYLRANLVEGKTTMEEAKRKLGKPTDISRSSGSQRDSEYWTYSKSQEGGRGLLGRISKIARGAHDAVGGSAATATAGNTAGRVSGVVYGSENVKEGVSGESQDFNEIRLSFENGVLRRYELRKE